MSFLAGWRLIFLLVVVALLVAYVVIQLQRRKYVVRFTNVDLLASVAPKRPGWRRHLAAALLLLALALSVVAFAQPTWPTQVPRERATVCLVAGLDVHAVGVDQEPPAGELMVAATRTDVEVGAHRATVAFSAGRMPRSRA